MARQNIFQRARQAIQKSVDRAVERIESVTSQAIETIRSNVERVFSITDDSDEIIQDIRERVDSQKDEIEERARLESEKINEFERDNPDEPDDPEWDNLTTTERLWLSWGVDIDELDGIDYGNIFPISEGDVNNLRSYQRIRKKAHPTVQSAIEYLVDIPIGYRVGVTKIGNFFYAIVVDREKSKGSRARKKRKMGKRNSR